MKHILVAVDFSPNADAVLSTAVELARGLAGELTVLHVAAPDPDFVGLEVGPQSVRDSRARVLEQEHRQLQSIAQRLRDEGVPARAFLFAGATAEKILEEAKDQSADLIVIGTHGRTGLASAFVGSVSRAVLHGATCPVVVVPAAKG